ncbi:protein ImuB [Sulfurisoma sediminicola]|uniref:Protein ImuB n=1 Tax=Sulfurisoma sediminicola TaxID=1381557 RepID=A0A497XEG6_9PROT|nr:protein ImuB [Sulfurisoma sediminicola]
MAFWAGGVTPRVSLVSPAGLLLEIGGCLRLWGGLDRLVAAVAADLHAQGQATALAAAPTPQGALWLAQSGTGALATDLAAMRARLDALPLAAIDLPAAVRDKLERFGARTLADARRLPRDGLARRLAPHGVEAVLAIARAYGEAADPRPDFAFPEKFSQQIEMPAPVEAAAALLFVARRLTAALAGWLELRQGGVDGCVLELAHSAREATHLVLRFAEATRDSRRFERVLRERLERLALTAPVAALRLKAETVEALPGKNGALFGGGSLAATAMAALVERLRARLGEDSVYGLAPHADHRPECATRKVCTPRVLPAGRSGGTAAGVIAAPPRPFWLLERPEALAEVDGRPWRRGALRLLAGPERIESGWWQSGEAKGEGELFSDVRRDYFVALTADSRWAWIFRELRAPGGWYLHGWFA